jgi:hypothetical protein
MLTNKTVRNLQPEDILAGHVPSVQRLAERLRKVIRATVPEAVEKAYPHWHGIGYSHPALGYFCAIFPHDELIKLGFEYGVLLPDPQGLLEGIGKQVRYVTIRSSRQIANPAIKHLLTAAVSLPEKREARLSMILGLNQNSFEKQINEKESGI